MTKLAVVEVKLLTREPGAIFALLIPLFILVVFGSSIPPGDTVLLPTAVAIAVAMVGLYLLPTTLATYRERGILRRMSTTPVRPANLLAVQVALQSVLALTTCALLIAVAGTVLDAHLPTAVGAVAVTLLFGTAAMFAVGLLIAALARNGRTANGVGVLLYFPMAYLAGLMQPTSQMPPLLARIGEYTPLGAFRQSMHQVWADTTPSPVLLAILVAYAVAISAVAARFFRWE
jgi:ABC-2 type transport system permease protein